VAGLAAWPSNLGLNATDAQVAASYQAHSGPAVVQYLLVEGVAGVLFGAVLAAALVLAPAGRATAGRATAGRATGAGLAVAAGWRAGRNGLAAGLAAAAAAISLSQCVLGLVLVARAHDPALAGQLNDVVNRLDGVKMLALAAVAALLAAGWAGTWRPAARLPRWLRLTAALAAAALTFSGAAYLLLAGGLAWAVYLAGPLLLAWIAGTGAWLTARARPRQGG
jgi:hypothetical protein